MSEARRTARQVAELEARQRRARRFADVTTAGIQPADCLHPVEARVASSLPTHIARCHDCGLHLNRHAEWVVA
jgi:hypothetical protein